MKEAICPNCLGYGYLFNESQIKQYIGEDYDEQRDNWFFYDCAYCNELHANCEVCDAEGKLYVTGETY